MTRSEVDRQKVTPMMRQYLEIKDANPDIIIFFRLGDFYEMFFEDAINVSRELELTLTGKNAGLDERIPMCGIPHHAANVYIEKLVEKGYKVGICEQLEDPRFAKGIVKRDLTRIISIGTLNDETLNEHEFNYIGSVLDFNHAYALSYADISTGDIYTTLIEHNISKLVSEIVSIGIKEIILSSKVDINVSNLLKNQFKLTISTTDEIENIKEYEYIYENMGLDENGEIPEETERIDPDDVDFSAYEDFETFCNEMDCDTCPFGDLVNACEDLFEDYKTEAE